MEPVRPSVLLVEDDLGIREALADVLAEEGFAVHAAENGRVALDWLQHNGAERDRPCVVLLDMMMPVMDGRAFLEAQGADPSLSAIPVLVISASASCASIARLRGVSGVLSKPFALDGLLEAIGRYV